MNFTVTHQDREYEVVGEWQDFGNGPYEHFGSRGVHIEWGVEVASCRLAETKTEIEDIEQDLQEAIEQQAPARNGDRR